MVYLYHLVVVWVVFWVYELMCKAKSKCFDDEV
jgi:hypothetical protein